MQVLTAEYQSIHCQQRQGRTEPSRMQGNGLELRIERGAREYYSFPAPFFSSCLMMEGVRPMQGQSQERFPRRSREQNNRSLFRRTIFLMIALGFAAFVPLIFRLYQLQIAEHTQWEERAAGQQTKNVSVTAMRGAIYDREGRTLAMSASVNKLILSPMAVWQSVKEAYQNEDGELVESSEFEKALYDKRKLIADGLIDLFGYDEEWLWKQLEWTANGYLELETELEEEDSERVREFISKNKLANMLYLTPNSKRYYPYSSVGSHVLGYMSQNKTSGDKKVGAQGIEAIYEDVLSGELGRVVTSKNGIGAEMISGYDMYFDAQDGSDLTLTVDERIQAMLEQTLAEGIETYDIQNGAFGLVMDPRTGAVLAMASTPDFDPNQYAAILNQQLLDELEETAAQYGEDSDEYKAARTAARNKQWRNRTISDTYEPGSVFKPVTVAIGLEEGIISMDSTYNCGGSKQVVPGVPPVSCHRHSGHGQQDLTHAVMNSCNVALMDIGEAIGAETMWRYWEDFGLRETTGIDLGGEVNSIMFDEDTFKGPYGEMSVEIGSFGQTFKVTPIQMITAFASLINGGHLMQPYLVQSIADSDGNTLYYHDPVEVRQVISESTSDKVRGILEQVVGDSAGSGHNASQSGYRIGGKTGTSEKRDELDNDDVMCSFMGFAPADDPQVLVLLVYDSPKRSAPKSNYIASGTYISGGNIAAPMAGALIGSILDYIGVEKQYSSDELTGVDAAMPRVTNLELTVAKGMLQNAGFNCRTVGTGNTVTGQVPAAGVSIPSGSTVVLYLDEEAPTEQVEVPELSGLTPTAAKNKLEAMGLFLRASGVVDFTSPDIEAVSQTIEAGTMVSLGTVVEVRFVSSIEYGDQ